VLNRFLDSHNVTAFTGSENVVLDRLVDLNRRLTEARARRIELEALYHTTKHKNVQYLTQVTNNNIIQQLKTRIDNLQAEESRLSTIFQADHPRLSEVSGQIDEARRRLSAETLTIVRGVEADYQAARARETAMEGEVEHQRQAALRLKEIGAQHAFLQGEVEANRAVYAAILNKLSETTVSKDSPLANMQIIEAAEMPLVPSSPAIIRNLQLSLALGLFLGVGAALLLEYLSSSVRTPEDVWRLVGVPTLGVVPHFRILRRWPYTFRRISRWQSPRALKNFRATADPLIPPALIPSHSPFSIILESYRAARTAILLSRSERPPQVVLITSGNPSEGKTTTAANLGITLARSGRKVLVVDADLRNGNCHSLLRARKAHGLADIFINGLTCEECVQTTQVEVLFFLSRGTTLPNPNDLLGSRKMREILQGMRARFDIVLLDSPPAIAVSDAAILSYQSDGVLLVLRAQKTSAKTVQRLVEDLDMKGASILGVILNGVDFRDPEYADYSRYYKSYYYKTQREQ
jgi:succinoglycan biosynthesis transport protein ExoP